MMDKVSPHFVYTVVALLLLGLIMVASSSSAIAEVYKGHVFAYFNQQLLFAVIGITIAMVATQTPLILWQKMAPYLLFIGIVGLLLVLLPGIGKEVNGSRRWIPLGSINIQTAEVIKLFIIIYIADYLYRHQVQFQRSFFKIFAPMILLSIPSILLLLQPDLGSVIVIGLTILLMLFLGGARISIVAILIGSFVTISYLLIFSDPYRFARIQAYLEPWADPYGTGFQITQALMAFGRGEWFGVGLGSSMQKLMYLPEAHTDFLYSILAEELGLLAAVIVLILFVNLILHAWRLGRRAELQGNVFSAQLAYGIGTWIALQVCINAGVNMGLVPTKGLTLPLMSYGGSSLVMTLLAIGLLCRIEMELALPKQQQWWRQ